jgi:hypothetical protein
MVKWDKLVAAFNRQVQPVVKKTEKALAKRKSRAAKKKSRSKKINGGNIGLKALGIK